MVCLMREPFFQGVRVVVLFLLWPLTTYAAGASLGDTFGAITAADWVSLALLAAVSGTVALLHRVRRSFEAIALQQAGLPSDPQDAQRIDWKLFAVCHMAGAMLVGFITFLFCEAADLNSYIEAAAIALASWRGAKLADKWADGLADTVSDRISSLLGRKAP